MISFVMKLVNDFEEKHGCRPNLLYVNSEHLKRLCEDFDQGTDIQRISEMLEMEIIVSLDAVHPHVLKVPVDGDTIREAV
jgi:hypothetical protein